MEREIFLLQNVQADSGTHPASCLMGNCVLSGWWRRWVVILSARLHVVRRLI